ncbi:hypothetical protein ACFV3E_44435 [Streptomyces sp. NPDC059718]
MSNFYIEHYIDNLFIIGPEAVNCTGEVRFGMRHGPGVHLSNTEARELATALTAAADKAKERAESLDYLERRMP